MSFLKKIIILIFIYCLFPNYLFSNINNQEAFEKYRGKLVRAIIIEPYELNDNNYLKNLIEIIPNYDILTPSSIYRSIENLYKTGFFSDINVYARKSYDGVALIFKLQKHKFIKEISINGINKTLKNKIQSSISLKKGKPFNEYMLAESLKNLKEVLQDLGYASASLNYSIKENEKKEVFINILISLRQPTIIRDVNWKYERNYSGNPPIVVKEGSILDKIFIDSQIHKFLQKQKKKGYINTSLSYKINNLTDNQASLEFYYNPGFKPIIRILGYKLNKSDIRHLIPLKEEEYITEALLKSYCENIKDFLNEKRFFNPKVSYQYNPNSALITFTIHPGIKYRKIYIKWRGNKFFSDNALNAIGLFSKGFIQSQAEEEMNKINAYYKKVGFIKPEIKIEKVELTTSDTLQIFIDIKENEQVLIKKINLIGINAFDEKESFQNLKISKQAYFSEELLKEDIQILQKKYFNEGYLNASISYSIKSALEENYVIIDININEGEKIIIDRIFFNGLFQTKPSFIQRYLEIEPDKVLSYNDILSTQKRLYDIGIFNKVEIELSKSSLFDSHTDVEIKFDENPSYILSYGIGYQQEDKARAFISLTKNNIFGYGIRNEFLLRYGFIEKRFFYTFYQPKFFNLNIESLFTATLEHQTRVSFNFSKRAIDFQINLPVEKKNYIIQYHYENSLLSNFKISPLLIDRRYRSVNVSSLEAIFIQDTRDDVLEPSKGYFHSSSLQIALKELGSPIEFIKFYSQFQTFQKIFNKCIFAFSGRIGLTKSFLPGGFLPINLRFFAGGSKTFRGTTFERLGPIDSTTNSPLGGNAIVLSNIEFRFSLFKNFGLVTFYDIGNVFRRSNWIIYGSIYMHAVGLGFRYFTPVGPIALDIGHPIGKFPEEKKFHFFLSIGHAF